MKELKIVIVIAAFTLAATVFVGCFGERDDGSGSEGYIPNSSPVATAGNNHPVLVGGIASFSGIGTDTDGSISKYEWDFNGDGTYDWSSGTTGSTTHVYGVVGIYTAVLRVTDNKGAIDTDTRVISVNPRVLDISGTWSGNWFRSDGGEEGTMIVVITQNGVYNLLTSGSISGDMTVTNTTLSISNEALMQGLLEGNDVVFDIAISTNGVTLTIDYQGTISEDGNQMSGAYSMSTGYTGTWDAMRQ